MLTKEELLRPRIKVIAPYPNMPYKLGEIVYRDEGTLIGTYQYDYKARTELFTPGCNLFDDYPHLFKRLEWWEEREESELPKYVNYNGAGIIKEVKIWYRFKAAYVNAHCTDGFSHSARVIIPATEQEYLEYIKNKPC